MVSKRFTPEEWETSAPTISSTDVESNPKDLLDDTATQQNTDVSVNKVTNNISNTQEIDEENVKFRVVKGFEKGNRILENATYYTRGG